MELNRHEKVPRRNFIAISSVGWEHCRSFLRGMEPPQDSRSQGPGNLGGWRKIKAVKYPLFYHLLSSEAKHARNIYFMGGRTRSRRPYFGDAREWNFFSGNAFGDCTSFRV